MSWKAWRQDVLEGNVQDQVASGIPIYLCLIGG